MEAEDDLERGLGGKGDEGVRAHGMPTSTHAIAAYQKGWRGGGGGGVREGGVEEKYTNSL